jgi:hypothetical protein
VPWQDNPAWDDAIKASDEIVVDGEHALDDRPTTEFLRRPGQLICDTIAWREPRTKDQESLRNLLREAGAGETISEPRLPRDELRARAADRLGLTLLNVAKDDLLELVRAGRRFVPEGIGFNHVMVANPQRHGGCGPPTKVTEAKAQIPGVAGEGPVRMIAVLDTGISPDAQSAPFPVDPNSDPEPPSPGSPAEGHGTMVAGVISRYVGGARILVKQVLNMPAGEADELEIALALGALPPEVEVINASFGGRAADDARMLALERALDALDRRTLVVCSAGNEGVNRPHYMAAYKRVVGVASAAVDKGQPAPCHYSNRGHWVDLSTQGSDVETRNQAGKPVGGNGTSFAAPKLVGEIVRIAGLHSIGLRAAATMIMHDLGNPVIAGGGTFVDMPTPP